MGKDVWMLRKVRNEYGKQIRKAYESHKVFEKRSNMTEFEIRQDGVSNTITTVQKDNYMLEKGNSNMEKGDAFIEENTSVYGNPMTVGQRSKYRIRKLTERECWRLMGFSDEDFEKAAAINSRTQLYKQAGNSIVENVLVAIFGQMVPGKENVYKELGNRNYNEEKE